MMGLYCTGHEEECYLQVVFVTKYEKGVSVESDLHQLVVTPLSYSGAQTWVLISADSLCKKNAGSIAVVCSFGLLMPLAALLAALSTNSSGLILSRWITHLNLAIRIKDQDKIRIVLSSTNAKDIYPDSNTAEGR